MPLFEWKQKYLATTYIIQPEKKKTRLIKCPSLGRIVVHFGFLKRTQEFSISSLS